MHNKMWSWIYLVTYLPADTLFHETFSPDVTTTEPDQTVQFTFVIICANKMQNEFRILVYSSVCANYNHESCS